MHSPKIHIKQRFIIPLNYSSCWYMHHYRLQLKPPFQHTDLNRHCAKKARWSGMDSIISYHKIWHFLFHAWLYPFLQFVRVPFFPRIPSILQVLGSKGKLYFRSQLDLGCAQKPLFFTSLIAFTRFPLAFHLQPTLMSVVCFLFSRGES